MYCPNCNQEYDGKFCPECGTKLIENPVSSGVALNLSGDANAISGGIHMADSHNVHNEDRSVHTITNTTSTVNNITQVAAQKSEMELLQEKKAIYLTECKRAYEDNVLEQSEVVLLEECRIKLGLDKATADAILESVRVMSERNARKSDLNPIARTKLKILTDNLRKNEVKALMDQIDSLEPLVRKYEHDELARKFFLVLAALKSDKCIELKENSKIDSYWKSYWSYLAYIKNGRITDAENVLISLDRFTNYPEDNMSVLAVAGALMTGNKAEAKEYLDAVTGEFTPALQRFVDSIYLLLEPDIAKEMGADEDTCAFYLVNFFGQKDAKAKAEEERLKREAAEAERRKKEIEEQKRREEVEARKKVEEEQRRKEAEIKVKAEAERKRKDEEEKKRKAEVEGKQNKENARQYKYRPIKKSELRKIIVERIRKEGNTVNLNDIDTSRITSMNGLFADLKCAIDFNGDVSAWNVSKVKDMCSMFQGCVKFEGKGLENWDVSKVEYWQDMFKGCNHIIIPKWYKEWAEEADAKNKAYREEKLKLAEKAKQKIIDKLIANMVLVEGGTFTMGATSEQGSNVYKDEKPTHKVTLSPFRIGRYEVTLTEWSAVMDPIQETNGSQMFELLDYSGTGKLPKTSVSWHDCQTFIAKLNALTGQRFRLPTEAEWEFAARGGNKSKGFKYAGSNDLEEVAWTWRNSGDEPLDVEYDEETIKSNHCKVQEVGQKSPNELGLYDMCGNVWEWCNDWFGDYTSSDKNNPQGPSSGAKRVVRGGAYQSQDSVRVAYRHCSEPDKRWGNYGFRLVLDPTQKTVNRMVVCDFCGYSFDSSNKTCPCCGANLKGG